MHLTVRRQLCPTTVANTWTHNHYGSVNITENLFAFVTVVGVRLWVIIKLQTQW